MIRSEGKAVFAPQYYASVYYYAAMWRCEEAIIDMGMRYDKRFKSVHRCTIADTQGLLTLTVPVARPKHVTLRQWQQVAVSSHGDWWHDHRVSLESAYGRTPYFEFYIDRFKPFLADTNMPITQFDARIDAALRQALGIDTNVTYADIGADIGDAIDLRTNQFAGIVDVPYYQVRNEKFGFVSGLSVLDLLFNMGPEAVLVLDKMSSQIKAS